ncbi:carbonate dehydratase [Aquisalimonas sp.]|uniref:carbonate dehydratase n=2 Tax=unclassified Aquisalimonas TaxID=2644645 RepID=UPI003459BCC8
MVKAMCEHDDGIARLIRNNRDWSERMQQTDPGFFSSMAEGQSPEYLWIGCSDSRVPANQVVGLGPGELFVHRNVANVVMHTDMSCMAVLQYAVEVLKVRHVVVCGHYGCGGVKAAMGDQQFGLIDNWLRHIKDVYARYETSLADVASEAERADRFCELNVVAQVGNVCSTTIVQNAWARGQELTVHGLIYGLRDGLLNDLEVSVSGPEGVSGVYRMRMD